MRLRNRRTADQPVDADGTARCSRCGSAVPVRPDGKCDLGHRVTSAEQALLAVPDSAPASPPAPAPDGGLEPNIGPPLEATGPPRELTGPPRELTGPPRELTGPPRELTGAPPETTGPPPATTGPPPEATGPPPEATGPPPEATGPPPEATGPPPEATGRPAEPTTDDLIADAFGENTFARPDAALGAHHDDERDLDADPAPAHQAHKQYDLDADPARASQKRDRYDLDAGSWDTEHESAPAADGSRKEAGPPDDRLATPDPTGSDDSTERPSSSKNTALALEELLDFGAELPPSALDDQRRAS